MKNLTNDKVNVEISGESYEVRELTLSEKIKLIGPLGEILKKIAGNAFFRKSESGSIIFDWNDEVSLAELNIDQIILGTIGALPELLKLSIPEFTDWENLPESETREILPVVLKVNDFKGFIINFFSLGTTIIR